MSEMESLLKLYDARDAMAEPMLSGKVDCEKGCASCCYQIIGCTKAEAIVIQNSQKFYPTFIVKEYYVEILGEYCKKFKECGGRSSGWWENKKGCVFLNNDICGIYESRPLMCRLHNSEDQSGCSAMRPGHPVRTVRLHHDANFVRLANIQWANMTAKERTMPEFKKAGNLYFMPAALLWSLGEMKESELEDEYLTADAGSGQVANGDRPNRNLA